MRVLAVGAHPDDLEILCGGTWPASCRRGTRSSCAMRPSATGKLRPLLGGDRAHPAREARRAAEICGAETTTLGLRDGEVNAADPSQQRGSSTSSARRAPN